MGHTDVVKRTGIAALLALSLGLAGCGGGGAEADADAQTATGQQPAPTGSAVPTAAAGIDGGRATSTGAPTSPDGSTASAAPTSGASAGTNKAALATSGLLIAADLPGFTATDRFFDGTENIGEIGLYQCLRIAGPQYVVREPGKTWTKGDRQIESTSGLAAKAADLKTKFAASKDSNAQSCYTEGLLRLVETPGASTSASSEPATAKVKGADDAFAVKFTVAATASDGKKTELTGYLVGATVGTVEIFVLDASSGAAPKLAEAVELAGKAAARARAALKK